MTNITRWKLGWCFMAAQTCLAAYAGYDLGDLKKVAIAMMLGLSFLAVVSFMSAWGEDQRR